ncbi:MAG: hypothetical protein JNK15_15745 [Planctomycetes bacterium]|nr:hypothetical protein [Planctomycetota bacterium]
MRSRRPLLFLPVLATTLLAPLAAQEREEPRFRIGFALSGGEFDFDSDGSNLDDNQSAAMFRLQFEGTSRHGFGGGVRLESLATDDDFFVGNGFAATEVGNGSLFGHFTYRLETHRFAMPIRAGLLLNGLVLDEVGSNDEVTYGSFGPYFEIAPEVVLAKRGKTAWSLYGELGFGGGYTAIDVEGDPNEYESSTGFFGLELGTRLLLNKIELGLAYVGRWQAMDESDPEGSQVVLGYDADYNGLLFSFAVVF